MSRQSCYELAVAIAPRYAVANRGQKSQLLDEFVAASGYNRKYAIALLQRPPCAQLKKKSARQRHKLYDKEVGTALIRLWSIANGICAKRLVPFLPELVAALERAGEMTLDPAVKPKVLAVSAATVDRILKQTRQGAQEYGRTLTKPGTLLRHQIPIRTFADWNDHRPGFFEVDLVAHCADNGGGEFVYTLTMTDIFTGWTECAALPNRSQQSVQCAIERIRGRLPMPLLGIDSDNGTEFINHLLKRYCDEHKITFTRCRPYKKNDQCHVEQKNWAVVRQFIGYRRYEGAQEALELDRAYQHLRLYLNFFQPSMKLVSKERDGAKVTKQYDKSQTPYQRLVSSETCPADLSEPLSELYLGLNPVSLLGDVRAHRTRLNRLADRREQSSPSATDLIA